MVLATGDVKVWLATGHMDMRKGFHGLTLQFQEVPVRAALHARILVPPGDCLRLYLRQLFRPLCHCLTMDGSFQAIYFNSLPLSL